jgi:CRISPR-associated protein Csb2
VLAIRCQFLNGTYQAAAPGNVGEPEWPPHPARLHAALVAAGWSIGDGETFPDDARAALEWLESLPTPTLAYSSNVSQRSAPEVYVPRNLTAAEVRDVMASMRAGRDPSRQSGRIPRQFPTSVPGDEPVWFVWDSDGDHKPHHVALSRLVQEVQYLGSSRSPVCCDVTDNPPGATLVPGSGPNSMALRVANPGFTAELMNSRRAHPPPRTGTIAPYRPSGEPVSPEPSALDTPFDELVVRALDPRFPYTLLHTPSIARAFREAVLAQAGDHAPAILHGHDCNPHVAFLPLANVGHAYATGQIVGVATAIPRYVSETDRASIVTAVSRVTRLHNLTKGASWRVLPAGERTLAALSPSRWVGPARRWQTVTPVILDRHPKTGSQRAFEQALRSTFTHACPHPPVDIAWSEIPWQLASLPGPAYTGQGLPSGKRIHVDVTFEYPVRGPVLVGRGRYFGVGLFAPVKSSRHDQPGDA